MMLHVPHLVEGLEDALKDSRADVERTSMAQSVVSKGPQHVLSYLGFKACFLRAFQCIFWCSLGFLLILLHVYFVVQIVSRLVIGVF